MQNYNKLLLRYFTPYFIVTALLFGTAGLTVGLVSNKETKIIKQFNPLDYILGSFMVVILLYFFYIYAIEIPLDMRRKVRKIADKYLEYASAQNPEMAKVKALLSNKLFMNGICNIVFNALTKEDRTEILSIIKEYDIKSTGANIDEKTLNKELEDKILQILKKRSLLDTKFNTNIFNNTLVYTQGNTK